MKGRFALSLLVILLVLSSIFVARAGAQPVPDDLQYVNFSVTAVANNRVRFTWTQAELVETVRIEKVRGNRIYPVYWSDTAGVATKSVVWPANVRNRDVMEFHRLGDVYYIVVNDRIRSGPFEPALFLPIVMGS